jgi:hypothetical protein
MDAGSMGSAATDGACMRAIRRHTTEEVYKSLKALKADCKQNWKAITDAYEWLRKAVETISLDQSDLANKVRSLESQIGAINGDLREVYACSKCEAELRIESTPEGYGWGPCKDGHLTCMMCLQSIQEEKTLQNLIDNPKEAT